MDRLSAGCFFQIGLLCMGISALTLLPIVTGKAHEHPVWIAIFGLTGIAGAVLTIRGFIGQWWGKDI